MPVAPTGWPTVTARHEREDRWQRSYARTYTHPGPERVGACEAGDDRCGAHGSGRPMVLRFQPRFRRALAIGSLREDRTIIERTLGVRILGPAELVCSCKVRRATLKSCRTHGGMWMTQGWNPQSGHQTSVDSSGAQYICNTRITCCCNHSYAMCGASSPGSDVWSLCRLWRLRCRTAVASQRCRDDAQRYIAQQRHRPLDGAMTSSSACGGRPRIAAYMTNPSTTHATAA